MERLAGRQIGRTRDARSARSEEHTSELQSQSNLVCRLLLEKKIADLEVIAVAGKDQSVRQIAEGACNCRGGGVVNNSEDRAGRGSVPVPVSTNALASAIKAR